MKRIRAGWAVLFSILTAVAMSSGCVGDEAVTDGGAGGPEAGVDGALDTAAGDAAPVDGQTCDATACGAACVDLQTSSDHCGVCGHACGKGFACAAGQCGNDVIDVAAGGSHGCVLHRDKRVSCWGVNDAGETGTEPSNADDTCGINKCRATPTLVTGLDNVIQLSLGADFGCAVRNDGTVLCWGGNGSGQLARALAIPYASAPAAVPLPVGKKAAKVTCGASSACVRTLTNEVYCWGANTNAEVGAAASAPVIVPSLVTFDAANITDVVMSADSGSHQHACAIRSDKTVWCWGTNDSNELGHAGTTAGDSTTCSGASVCNLTPLQVTSATLTGVTSVAVGPGSTCVVSDTGTRCFGNNIYNEVGSTAGGGNVFTPTLIPGLPAADAGPGFSVYQGASNEYALDGSGHLWAWGVNTLGQLGLPPAGNIPCQAGGSNCVAPTPTLSSVARFSAGYQFALALRKDGKVLAWGENDDAELAHLPSASGSGDQTCATTRVCNPTATVLANLP